MATAYGRVIGTLEEVENGWIIPASVPVNHEELAQKWIKEKGDQLDMSLRPALRTYWPNLSDEDVNAIYDLIDHSEITVRFRP